MRRIGYASNELTAPRGTTVAAATAYALRKQTKAVVAGRNRGAVTRDLNGAAVATGDLVLPSPASIAHTLIEDWYGAPVPTSD